MKTGAACGLGIVVAGAISGAQVYAFRDSPPNPPAQRIVTGKPTPATLTEEQAYQKRHQDQMAQLDAAQAADDKKALKIEEDEHCRSDVSCWSKPYVSDAQISCEKSIER